DWRGKVRMSREEGFAMNAARVKATCCAGPPISRREMLQIGGASLLGLGLPSLLRAQSDAGKANNEASADRLLVIFLNGGPSHLDMWDMKPSAPAEIR